MKNKTDINYPTLRVPLQKLKGINIFTTILRIFLGLTFVVSALLKLFPIEAFDARILETAPFLGWTFSIVIARLIIACELALGICIIVGKWLKKVVYPLTLAMMLFFTGIVIYSLIRFGNQPNCGCFGELLPFSNIESLIKNIFFIAATVFLYSKTTETSLKYWWIGFIVLSISIFTIFMTNKVMIFLDGIELEEPIPSEYVDCESYQIENVNLYDKHLAIFLSCTCPKCQEMVRNMETINRIYPLTNVYYFICEDSIAKPGDLFDNQTVSFPYISIPIDTFYTYIPAPYLPFIGLVDSGKYTRIWTGASFDFDKVIPILKQEGLANEK